MLLNLLVVIFLAVIRLVLNSFVSNAFLVCKVIDLDCHVGVGLQGLHLVTAFVFLELLNCVVNLLFRIFIGLDL